MTSNKYKNKYKLTTSTKKYIDGTQALNISPDYSAYYNAQNDVYNRRTRESVVNNTALNPIADSLASNNASKIGNLVGRTGSSLIDQNSITSSGRQDTGSAFGSGALKYGALGASVGSVAGPIGTAIGGAVGAIAGGTYSAVHANKLNKLISQGEAISKVQNDAAQLANKRYNYNLQGDVNKDIAQSTGFARKGKYKIKMVHSKNKTVKEEEVGLKLPNPNKYKSRLSDYRKKPTR